MVRRRHRAWLGLSCLLLAVVLAGCAQSTVVTHPPANPAPRTTTVPPAAATTQTRTFTPYESGKLTTAVAARQTGTCWTSSITVPRAGVYRCLAANQIFDPCFAPPGERSPRTVACYADPWTPATEITLNHSLPRRSAGLPRAKPWALELANGATCVSVTGTVRTYHGDALTYACARGRSAALVGSGQHGSVLRVDYGLARHGRALQRELVTVAWS